MPQEVQVPCNIVIELKTFATEIAPLDIPGDDDEYIGFHDDDDDDDDDDESVLRGLVEMIRETFQYHLYHPPL